MRHGAAEDRSSSGRDDDRALTAPGRERVRDVARKLVSLGEAPLHVVSSPLVRALQTAEIVAATIELEGAVEVSRELAPGGQGAGLVESLFDIGRKRAMLVGHEPDLSLLAGLLIGEPIPVPLGKAMVLGLSSKPAGGALRFVLDPQALDLSIDLRAP
jgi:phosphohistidine phosphatase